MKIFYVQIDVVFGKPLRVVGTNGRATGKQARGFIQEIGCTAPSETSMRRLVREYATANDSRTEPIVHFKRIGVIKSRSIAREVNADSEIVAALKQDPMKQGVWYSTGKGFYSESPAR